MNKKPVQTPMYYGQDEDGIIECLERISKKRKKQERIKKLKSLFWFFKK